MAKKKAEAAEALKKQQEDYQFALEQGFVKDWFRGPSAADLEVERRR